MCRCEPDECELSLRAENEHALRVVELARNREHLEIGEPSRIGDHGQRISAMQAIRKYVRGVKSVGHCVVENANAWRSWLLPDASQFPPPPFLLEPTSVASLALNKHVGYVQVPGRNYKDWFREKAPVEQVQLPVPSR